jgi:hypothetical protein
MIIKVPIYVDIDSKDVNRDSLSRIVDLISEASTEHLQDKLPRSKKTLKFRDDEGKILYKRKFEFVTRSEAIDRFR